MREYIACDRIVKYLPVKIQRKTLRTVRAVFFLGDGEQRVFLFGGHVTDDDLRFAFGVSRIHQEISVERNQL